jgi:hypothetical protein
MRTTTLALVVLAACGARGQETYTASMNFAADLDGEADTRERTWGKHDAAEWTVEFSPPSGQRVQIMSVTGDLVSWFTLMGKRPAVPEPGRYAGVLFSLGRTEIWGAQCPLSLCNTDTFVYIQDALSAPRPASRAPVDTGAIDFVLGDDHTLHIKVASWLNDTGLPVHLEPTFVVRYRWVKEKENQHVEESTQRGRIGTGGSRSPAGTAR